MLKSVGVLLRKGGAVEGADKVMFLSISPSSLFRTSNDEPLSISNLVVLSTNDVESR